ncbi:hypothetical protein NRB20_22290 [Nocardia sp. RB20]|uniref:Condensation domain-containing protein n=2 Tax=Nocardia macrotermitis TaxID=2585198 RepID=A0A7K0D2I2_9NOCA|nr:hypothetical protein [Nocardia macrotermitis]
MSRLGVVDEIFLRTHRGMGTPIALQGLWRTADRVAPEVLEKVHAALRTGPLGRRVVRARVPGARPYWRANVNAHPLAVTEHALPADEVLNWADEQGFDLDPEYGPGWRLATATLADGGSIVALTCSHVLADGRGLAIAVDQALSGTTAAEIGVPQSNQMPLGTAAAEVGAPRSNQALSAAMAAEVVALPSDQSLSGTTIAEGIAQQPDQSLSGTAIAEGIAQQPDQSLSGAMTAEIGAPQSDWLDAWRQWGIILGGTARALRRGVPKPPSTSAPDRPGPARTCGVVLEIPAADWERTAAAHGATANSLFVHLIAQMLWHSGFDGPEIVASIPVDTRDEPRVDNDMSMTEITVTRSDTAATVREKCRAAYEYRMSSPGGLPEEILQVLPARTAHALTRGAGERDVLCSNIGPLPTTLTHLGPHPCLGVAARAIHPALTPPLPRTRLSAYLSHLSPAYTLALTSLDPTHIQSPTALTDLAHTTLTTYNLTPTFW